MFIDTHTHLDFAAFDADRPAVLSRSRAVGVTGWIVAGVRPEGWAGQAALAETPGVLWTAGLHPQAVAEVAASRRGAVLEQLAACFDGPRPACAVGEIGLDRRAPDPDGQRAWFREQLAMARTLNRPVVLHVVGRHGAALEVLRGDGLLPAGGVVHGYSGSREVAEAYLGLGLHLGIGAAITRLDNRRLREAVSAIPLDRLLLETDAPDQPLPEGPRRSEPAGLPQIAAALATQLGLPAQTLLERSTHNAQCLYGSSLL